VGGGIETMSGSVTNILQGSVIDAELCRFQGTVNVIGGDITTDYFIILTGGLLNLAGSQFRGDLTLNSGADANLFVTDLSIDGVRIDLVPGLTQLLTQRTGLLEATLADGTSFSRQLNGELYPRLTLEPGATLSATLVPSPSSLVLLTAAGLLSARRRR